jgi:hypothetical protein
LLSDRNQAFADAGVSRFLTRHITTIFRINGLYDYITGKTAEHIAIRRRSGHDFSEKNWMERNGKVKH